MREINTEAKKGGGYRKKLNRKKDRKIKRKGEKESVHVTYFCQSSNRDTYHVLSG